MKTLTADTFARSRDYVLSNGRELDRQRFIHFFERHNCRQLLHALAEFQNDDGGFGHGLEPDFLLPHSSAMATSIALRMMVECDAPSRSHLVTKAIAYLVESYDQSRMRWTTVPATVNDFPHAPWWHYQTEIHGTVLDNTWGNPTAEILAHLIHYQELFPADLLAALYAFAFEYLMNQPDEMEMHELHCFLKLDGRIAGADTLRFRQKLERLVVNTVSVNPDTWQTYAAQPLDYVSGPDSFLYPAFRDAVSRNLDFWVDTVTEEGIWLPSWSWGQYEEEWLKARQVISCSLTIDRLRVLARFGRVEK